MGKRGSAMPKLEFSSERAQQILEEQLAGTTGTVGVMVTDLGTGKQAAVNPDREFPAASVAKIPIAMTVLNQVSEGQISLDDQVRYQSATDYEGGAGSLQYEITEGEPVSVRRLLDRMIVVSDNIARNMLERYVGSGTIREYMLEQGVQPPYYAPWPMMTARGTDTLLVRLERGEAGITPDLTNFLIDLMSNTVYNDRLPAKLPEGVTVAHKVGTLPNNVHDAGLVYAPDRSFAISVFTEDIPYDDATNLIANLAAAMYEYEDSLVRGGSGA